MNHGISKKAIQEEFLSFVVNSHHMSKWTVRIHCLNPDNWIILHDKFSRSGDIGSKMHRAI
jgi:hypothetical protein